MRALLDTDVILDLVLERSPWADDAEVLVEAHERGLFDAYLAPITPVNVFYIVRKLRNGMCQPLWALRHFA